MPSQVKHITDLEDYLEHNEDTSWILTATCDPPHAGHMEVIARALQHYNDSYKRVIVAVHTANKAKNPIDIEQRIEFVDWSIEHFIPQHLEVVSVFNSDKLNQAQFFSTLLKFKQRLKRMSGEPREAIGLESVVFERSPRYSSTRIRECISRGDVATIQEIVAKKVLDKIIEERLYGYREAA